MPSKEPALGVELKRVAVHRQHCTLGPVPAGELNQLASAGPISDCLRISVALSLPCSHLAITLPPFCPPSSSSRLPLPPDKDGDGDGNGDRHRHCGRCYPYPYCCHHQPHSSHCQLCRCCPGALPSLPHQGPRWRRRQQCRCGRCSGGIAAPAVGRNGPNGRGNDKDSQQQRQRQ